MVANVIKYVKLVIKKFYQILEDWVCVNPKKSSKVSWYEDKDEKNNSWEVKLCNYVYGDSAIKWQYRDRVKFSGVCVVPSAKVLMCNLIDSVSYYDGGRKAVVCAHTGRPVKIIGMPSLFSLLSMSGYRNLSKLKTKKIYLKNSVALMGGVEVSPKNYFHFWVDVIGDLWHIKQVLPPSEMPDYYLVNFCGLPWQWDILKMCGLNEKQVIPYSSYDCLYVEKLVSSFRDKGARKIPRWLSTAIHEMSGWNCRSQSGSRLIFISRSDADRRRMINEEALCEALCRVGFEVYVLSNLNVKQQQRLFASASIVCSPHGAALTNLVWCGAGTVIIDILSESHLVPCFRELSAQNDLIYFPVVCQRVDFKKKGLNDDIKLSVSQIDFILGVVGKYSNSTDIQDAGAVSVSSGKC